jgi:hypothetical protein
MNGASGTYAVNGVDFSLQPTTGKWIARETFGVDGHGHPIYSPIRSFEVSWQLSHPSDLKQIIDAYNLISTTGTSSFDLPKWGTAILTEFHTYSGCIVDEPILEDYFAGYSQNIRWTIRNIRT